MPIILLKSTRPHRLFDLRANNQPARLESPETRSTLIIFKDRATMTQRPPITPFLTLTDFTSWHWLKADLVRMCRTFGVSTTGTKVELEDKLRRHLSGREGKKAAKRQKAGKMPARFTPETVIGPGWRCNPALGAYFRGIIGARFHFDAAMRDFIHHEAGRTLGDAAVCFRASTLPRTPKAPIPQQLEYNQHFRDFFATHPGSTRQQAIACWWEKRSKCNGTRRPSGDTDAERQF